MLRRSNDYLTHFKGVSSTAKIGLICETHENRPRHRATLSPSAHFPNNQLIMHHTLLLLPSTFGTRWHLSKISTVIYCLSLFYIFQHLKRRGRGRDTQLNMHKPRLFLTHNPQEYTKRKSLITPKIRKPESGTERRGGRREGEAGGRGLSTQPSSTATWQFSDAQVKIFDTPLQIFCTTSDDDTWQLFCFP